MVRRASPTSASGQAEARRSWWKTQRHLIRRSLAARSMPRASSPPGRGPSPISSAPRGAHEPVPVPAGVADPPPVDLRVEARLEPGYPPALVVVGAADIVVDVDVAPAGGFPARR